MGLITIGRLLTTTALVLLWLPSCRHADVSSLQDGTISAQRLGAFADVGYLSDVMFSVLDDRLAIAAADNGYIYALRLDDQSIAWRTFVQSRLEEVAFSPDGAYVAVVGNRDMIVLIDAATGEIVRRFEGHANVIMSLAFSPRGRYLATGSSDASVMIWDVESGQDVHLFEEWEGSQVNSLAFSADGRYLAAGINEELTVYNLEDFTRVRTFHLGDFWIDKMRLSPDMAYAALSGDLEDDVLLLDMENGEIVKRLQASESGVRTLNFSPDHSRLITGDTRGLLKVFDVLSGEELLVIDGFNHWVLATGISRDGKRLLVSDMSTETAIFEVNYE